jgi:hypothetical protein
MITGRKAALAAGVMFYRGRPCPKCGGEIRYTKGQRCLQCTRAQWQDPVFKEQQKANWRENYRRGRRAVAILRALGVVEI